MHNNERIISSQSLQEEAEKETGKSIIASNGGATRYSSRDKSYKNIIDFFIKVFRNSERGGDTSWSKMCFRQKVVTCVKATLLVVPVIGLLSNSNYYGGKLAMIISVSCIFIIWGLIRFITRKK